MRFWIKRLHVGRLSISIVRNDQMARLSMSRVGYILDWLNGVYFTLRVGSLYLNIDLAAR